MSDPSVPTTIEANTPLMLSEELDERDDHPDHDEEDDRDLQVEEIARHGPAQGTTGPTWVASSIAPMAGDAPPPDASARAEALLAAAEAAAQAAAAARAQAMAALEGAPAASGPPRPRPAPATAIGAGTPGTAGVGAPGTGGAGTGGAAAGSAGTGAAGTGGAASAAPGRDPTAPARLLALAEELAARTHDARHQLDALADAVERALAAAGPRAAGGGTGGTGPGGRPGPTAEDLRAATARLVAVEMALAGASRAEVSDVLARAFGTADDRLLDEVLGGTPPPARPPARG